MHPKTNASRTVNIRKFLTALSKKKGINPNYLHCEDKILAGDGHTIRKLLLAMREVYKFNRSTSRPRYI